MATSKQESANAKNIDSVEKPLTPRLILVPTDGSENAGRALNAAINLSKTFDSVLFILTVTPRGNVGRGIGADFPGHTSAVQEYYDEMDKRSERILEDSIDLAKKEGLTKVRGEAVPQFDSVAQQILEQAESKKADLIVIGTRGLGGFKKLLLGSVSSEVVTHAGCNVMVVR